MLCPIFQDRPPFGAPTSEDLAIFRGCRKNRDFRMAPAEPQGPLGRCCVIIW